MDDAAERKGYFTSDRRFTAEDLYELVRVLRSPEGCPWDRVQTHSSLERTMVEEAYEAVDAIREDDTEHMKEELGDVLLQVLFHCVLAEEEGRFDLDDVADKCTKKMVSRHPHVFGDAKSADGASTGSIPENWDNIKKKEHEYGSLAETLDGIPHSFPALLRAAKYAKKIRQAGEDICVNEKEFTGDERRIISAGREFYDMCRKAEAAGINPEEALAFYISELTKEAEKRGL